MKDLNWFKERVGKRVYRDNNNCQCNVCLAVYEHGLVIIDENHAHYLFDVENELGLIYSDTKHPK